MILVAVVIVVSTAIGVAAERRFGEGAQRVMRATITVLLWTVLPFVGFVSIVRLDLGGGVGGGLALAYVMSGVVGALAWLAGRRLGLSAPALGALVVACIVSNTGYLGIPLSATLLGAEALAPAVAYDTLVNGPLFLTAGFAIGAALGTRAGSTPRERVRAFFVRNPPLLAVLAALVAPDALAPDVLLDVAEALVFAVLPIGFLIVGVTLAAEAEDGALAFPPPFTRPVGAALVLRLAVAPLVMAGLSAVTFDIPDAYVLEAAMPSGVNALVVAHAYGLDLRVASAALAWTTAVAVAAAVGAGIWVSP